MAKKKTKKSTVKKSKKEQIQEVVGDFIGETNSSIISNTTFDAAAYAKKIRKDREEKELMAARNKKIIFRALKALKIKTGHVTYYGSGDNGQIEDCYFYKTKEDRVDTDGINVVVETQSATFDQENDQWVTKTSKEETPLKKAVEEYAYRALEILDIDYYNNDGGSGNFTFDVKTGKIKLVHEEYYTESNISEHTL
jgi:hypothetical protein